MMAVGAPQALLAYTIEHMAFIVVLVFTLAMLRVTDQIMVMHRKLLPSVTVA